MNGRACEHLLVKGSLVLENIKHIDEMTWLFYVLLLLYFHLGGEEEEMVKFIQL